MKRKPIIAASGLALLVLSGAWYVWGPAATPQGQAALTDITPQTLEEFRKEFNSAADKPRIVALLSPT